MSIRLEPVLGLVGRRADYTHLTVKSAVVANLARFAKIASNESCEGAAAVVPILGLSKASKFPGATTMKPQSTPSTGSDIASVLRFEQRATLSPEQVDAIEKFIEQAGGVENARRALDALLKLEIAA